MNNKYLFLSLMISLLLIPKYISAQNQPIEIKKVSSRTVISVIKRVEQEYYYVTKNQPFEMSVNGPAWLRIYTRLLWHQDMAKTQTYKLVVSENEQDKLLTFISELSNTALGAQKQRYSKWRSFYIEVPQGKNNYKISLVEAKSETVAIRVSFEKPVDYHKIIPDVKFRELQFVDKERITNYYEVTDKTPVKVKIEGPATLRVTCRLNYDYTLEGKQNYTISATVSGKEWQAKTFRTSKSQTGLYKNASDLIPSIPHNMYLDIPPGIYLIEFKLKGGLGKSASLHFAVKPKAQYE